MAQASTHASFADRARLARLCAGAGVLRLRQALGRALAPLALLRARAPSRLLLAPQDIRTADPTIANDIYAGYFAFAGKVVNTHGQSPFDAPAPSEAWTIGVASFGWLRHLRAADTPLARANARALVGDWMASAERRVDPLQWEPRVAARRLLSWLCQSPLILDGADHVFYQRFMKALGRHAALLQNALACGLSGEDRLIAAIALTQCGLCAEGLSAVRRTSTPLLADALSKQLLPDGGHINRNPQTIVDLLLDLLPLRQTYAARGQAAPPQLLNAIDRILPLLRLFRQGDGSLALFNGMGVTAPHQLATALAHDDARAAAMLNAPYSGYQRLEARDASLVMDTGAPPPHDFSLHAHAGCLSFELAARGQRIVVNCGAPAEERGPLRDAARATAAHSTLTLGDTSSCRFAPDFGPAALIAGRVIAGPRRVSVRRDEDAHTIGLDAAHDGYERGFGLIHARTLALSRDGSMLCGEDRLEGAAGPGAAYAIRFHLHPASAVGLTEDGLAIFITTPNAERWVFQSSVAAQIEESIYFGGAERARAAEQIVIHANADETRAVAWSFRRIEAPVGHDDV